MCLHNVFKTFFQDVFKMSSRCIQDQQMFAGIRLKLLLCNACCILSLRTFEKQQLVSGVPATRVFSSFHNFFLRSHILELLKKEVLQKQ